MKSTRLLLGFCWLLFMACNSDTDRKANQPKETEKALQTKESTSEKDFLIKDKGAGIFVIGNPIPTTLEQFSIIKEQQTRLTEEGPTEETVFIIKEGEKELLHILPAIDIKTGETTGEIGELRVKSPRYKTPEGIGVGSTLSEFIKQYPDYKLWYTYVSDRYVLEAEESEAQFLLKEKDFLGEMKVTSVMTPLNKEDFKNGARISSVRIIP